MRFITYASAEGPRVATLQDEGIIDLNRTDAEIPCSLRALLAQGPEGLLSILKTPSGNDTR